jgi:hypothetical protein
MSHTKEPWFVMPKGVGVKPGNGFPTVYAADTELRYICKCADTINIEPTDNLANAERIALCINACAGITNEALKKDVVKCALINLEESLELDEGKQFYFDGVPVLEETK